MNKHWMLSNAKAFRKISIECLTFKELPDGTSEMVAVPGIVNIAFSIELYLKYIIFSEQNLKVEGHKINDLFKLLSSETYNIIKSNMHLPFLFDFEIELKHHSTIFIEWRYMHEKIP